MIGKWEEIICNIYVSNIHVRKRWVSVRDSYKPTTITIKIEINNQIEKWTKGMNIPFSEEETQITNNICKKLIYICSNWGKAN